jgi:NADH dehydrogenase FAD-containing subunit
LKSSNQEHIRVVIIGGGYSGVEIATNIAEYLGEHRGKITIVHRNEEIMHNIYTERLEREKLADLVQKRVDELKQNH